MSQYEEAVETIKEENVSYEVCIHFGDYVAFRQDINGEKLPMNMNRDINKRHKEMILQCLEPISFEKLYEIASNSQELKQ